jgi:hypothetical protein
VPARPKTKKKKKKQSGINLPRLTERSNASKVGEDVIGLETKSYPRAKWQKEEQYHRAIFYFFLLLVGYMLK